MISSFGVDHGVVSKGANEEAAKLLKEGLKFKKPKPGLKPTGPGSLRHKMDPSTSHWGKKGISKAAGEKIAEDAYQGVHRMKPTPGGGATQAPRPTSIAPKHAARPMPGPGAAPKPAGFAKPKSFSFGQSLGSGVKSVGSHLGNNAGKYALGGAAVGGAGIGIGAVRRKNN